MTAELYRHKLGGKTCMSDRSVYIAEETEREIERQRGWGIGRRRRAVVGGGGSHSKKGRILKGKGENSNERFQQLSAGRKRPNRKQEFKKKAGRADFREEGFTKDSCRIRAFTPKGPRLCYDYRLSHNTHRYINLTLGLWLERGFVHRPE